MKQSVIWKSIVHALQGAIVGVGAILPGVSGGVLCVAFGLYEPVMALLTHPRKAFKAHYKMFIPFLVGWGLGFILLARGVEALFGAAPAVALMLFFGLICGTLPDLFQTSVERGGRSSWTPFVLSLSLAYLFFHVMEGGAVNAVEPSFWGYLLCGALWGLSLIIPGFSSSTILIYLGLFEPMTEGIGSLDPAVLGPFVIGIAVTALPFARLVTMLFERNYGAVSRVILGFVIASSLKVLPSSFPDLPTLLISLACFGGGFAVALAMDGSKEKESH